MRNTYLIDFENVGSEGLNGVASLTAEDRVILFYSANSNRMTVRAHQAIVASPAHFDYFEVAVGGKNALDHQLGTYLGYMVATNASERYFIVSHDNGFKFLSTFWLAQDPSLQISMCDNIKISLRVRPTERPRPVNKAEQPAEQKPEQKAEQKPVEEKKPEPVVEAPVEIKPEPVVEAPVEVKPEPAVEAPVEIKPEPVVEAPVEVKPEPVVEAPVEVKPEPVAEAPVEVKPAGPLPALGSQSRSRSNSQRGRVRSESVLATLKQSKPAEVAEEPKPEQPKVEEPKAEPETPAVEEPTVEIAVVAEPPVVEVVEVTEPAEAAEPAEVEAAAEVETPAEQPKSSRSRRRRTRSNRKEQKPAEPAAEPKAEEAKPEAPVAEEVKPEPAKAETPKSEKKPEKKAEPKAEAPAEPKLYVLSDAASAALSTLLQEHPKVNEARVRELIAGSKKQILCNTLRRQLGQEQGLALYNQIKKLAWK